MDEEFFLEDVEDDMDEEEDLALGAAEDDLTFGDADEDLSLGASKKFLDHIMLSNKDNKPTQRMTKMAMKVFFQFLCSHGIEINIETCTKQELANTLKQFFLKVRKSDGEVYKKNAFGSIKFGLIRGIREIRKDFDFAYDQEYNVAMQAFKLTMRKLGFLGKTVDHIEKISLADLETLYASNTFNIHRPTSLQYKVFFEIQFFLMCSRGRNYLRNLMPSHIAVKWNKNGRKYIQFVNNNENFTDGYDSQQVDSLLESTSDVLSDVRPRAGYIFELPGNPKCPVAAIEKYLSKLPPQCNFFFAQPADRHKFNRGMSDNEIWYQNAALGKNSLGAMMKEISKQAELSRSYSNFCIHATSVSLLNWKGYDVKNYFENKEISGEFGRNVSMATDMEILERMSDVLSKTIIPEQAVGINSCPGTGVHNDLRRDLDFSDPECNMYLVPMKNYPEDQLSQHTTAPQQGPSQNTISPQGTSQNMQILSVPPVKYTSQNATPQVFIKPITPHSQVQILTKNAVRIQPFANRSLLQNKIQTIAPGETTCRPPLVQNFVKPVVIPQVIIKTEPLMPASQITTYSDFTSHSWSVITPSTSASTPGQTVIPTWSPAEQQGIISSVITPASTATPGQTVKLTWSPVQQQGTISSVTTPVVQTATGGTIQKEAFPNSDSQSFKRHENQVDNSNNQVETQQSITSLQNTLKQKDDLLQEAKKKIGQLELYQREYKRLLHSSTILQQHLATSQTNVKDLTTKIENMKKTKQYVDDSKNSHSFEQLCCDKQLFRHYTGYTPEEFQMLFHFLIPEANSSPYRGRGHNLSVRTQLLMTLCKLKNNFTFIDLRHRFHVSKVVVKNIFCCWINHMAEKFDDVYVWPHRETLKAQLPRHFQQDFPSTLALFKCVKIKVSQISRDNLLGNNSTRNVRHGIIAVDPRGCVIGCSGLVGEVYTSSELFRKSGLKNQLIRLLDSGRLQQDDGILSENFDIAADLGEIGLKLNDVAFSKCDIDDDLKSIIQKQRVQTHKVLIDKAVCRFKKFQIVSQVIPQSLSSSSDKIFQVTAFLTNFLPPLSLDVN